MMMIQRLILLALATGLLACQNTTLSKGTPAVQAAGTSPGAGTVPGQPPRPFGPINPGGIPHSGPNNPNTLPFPSQPLPPQTIYPPAQPLVIPPGPIVSPGQPYVGPIANTGQPYVGPTVIPVNNGPGPQQPPLNPPGLPPAIPLDPVINPVPVGQYPNPNSNPTSDPAVHVPMPTPLPELPPESLPVSRLPPAASGLPSEPFPAEAIIPPPIGAPPASEVGSARPLNLELAVQREENVNVPARDFVGLVTDSAIPLSVQTADALAGRPVDPEPEVQLPLPARIKGLPNEPRAFQATTHTCTNVQITHKAKTNMLDILFVVDTSASLDSERSRVARSMRNFVEALDDPKTDYEIAVMLAHEPSNIKSPKEKHPHSNNWAGELYKVGAGDKEVLSYREHYDKEIKSGKNREAARAEANRKIILALENKMANPARDHTNGQGELLLYTAYKAVTDPSIVAKLKAKHFLREGAALAIFFFSDEDDVCYDYRNCNPNFPQQQAGEDCHPAYKNNLKLKPPADKITGRDPHEQITYDSPFCATSVHGERLQPDKVYHVLADYQLKNHGKPLIISGVVYKNSAEIVRNYAKDKYADEKEVGHGMIDLMQANGTDPVSLASIDYGEAMSVLGQRTKGLIEIDNVLECETNVPLEQIDPSSFKVEITGEGGMPLMAIDPVPQSYVFRKKKHDGRTHGFISIPAHEMADKVGQHNASARIEFKDQSAPTKLKAGAKGKRK